jgi:hypothetical protein
MLFNPHPLSQGSGPASAPRLARLRVPALQHQQLLPQAEILRDQQHPRPERRRNRPDQKANHPPLRPIPVVAEGPGPRLSTAKPLDGHSAPHNFSMSVGNGELFQAQPSERPREHLLVATRRNIARPVRVKWVEAEARRDPGGFTPASGLLTNCPSALPWVPGRMSDAGQPENSDAHGRIQASQ